MSFKNLIFKFNRKLNSLLGYYLFQYPRIIKYNYILSNCENVIGKPFYKQPTRLLGKGSIIFGKNINIGVISSPYLYSSYGTIEARQINSKIMIGDNVWINNNFMIVSEGEGIEIGEKTLIGLSVEIIDSDFHDLHPDRRMGGIPKTGKITIGKNVFIGSNVRILKGVTIGDNTVIANSSIVIKSIPANVIAGGYPCKVIKEIDAN